MATTFKISASTVEVIIHYHQLQTIEQKQRRVKLYDELLRDQINKVWNSAIKRPGTEKCDNGHDNGLSVLLTNIFGRMTYY